jgi:hypothetical protein
MCKTILALFCLAASCDADSATATFTCQVETSSTPTYVTVTGPNPCVLGASNGAYASATGAPLSAPSILGPETTFEGDGSASIVAEPGYPEYFLTGAAGASLTWSVTATTSGPPRAGFIDLSLSAHAFSLDGNANSTASVGGYTASGSSEGCEGECTIDELLPFTLGTPFNIGIFDSASLTAEDSNFGSAEGDSDIQFSLFEADGVTPVMIEPVPEPGALGLALLGMGTGVLFWWLWPSTATPGMLRALVSAIWLFPSSDHWLPTRPRGPQHPAGPSR